MGPDFICIGAPKAGTGWLFDQLSWHPEIWMPPVKELRYLKIKEPEKRPKLRRLRERLIAGEFDVANRVRLKDYLRPVDEKDLEFINRFLSEERRDLKRYARLFEMKGSLISGDITPLYSILEVSQIRDLLKAFPKLKVIYLIREPVSRVWSHIQMHKRRCEKPNHRVNFDIESLGDVKKFVKTPEMQLRSCPTRVMDRWQPSLPPDQFFLAFFDEILSDPANVIKKILQFLDVNHEIDDRMLPPSFNRKDTRPKYIMTPEIGSYLKEIFHEENSRCAQHFGGVAKTWVDT